MKILLLQSKPFLPVLDGGNEASRVLASELISCGYDVDCLTFSSDKHPFNAALFTESPWNKLNIDHVRVNLSIKPIPAFRALASGNSYNLDRFTHPDWSKKIEKKAKEKFDVILIDSLFAAAEIEHIKSCFPKAKFILRTHNVEHQIWTEQANNEPTYLKKQYLKSISRQLKNREIEIINQFDLVLAISALDKATIEELTQTDVTLLPYFPEIHEDLNSTLSPDFFFLGSMNWTPNVEAHDELTNYLFPEILEKVKDAKLVFGGGSQDELKKVQHSNISYNGFVDDKIDFMMNNGILLAPIKSGSGVRIKILEALSLGVPVVTTKKGAEGIPFENGNGILIAETDFEFIDLAIQLSKNADLRKSISLLAKKNLVNWKAQFAMKAIFDKYVQ